MIATFKSTAHDNESELLSRYLRALNFAAFCDKTAAYQYCCIVLIIFRLINY